jgi:hypothetical protein
LVRSITHGRVLVSLSMLAWVSCERRIGPSDQSTSTQAAPAT